MTGTVEPVESKESLLDEARLRREESDNRLRYSVEFSQGGLKGIFLANGGAILSLLTFVGNVPGSVGRYGIFWAFIWFCLGLVTCLGAYVFAASHQNDLMNSTFNEALNCRSRAYGSPERFDGTDWEKSSERKHTIASTLALTSIGLFAAGAFVALNAIT